ncbi:MAG: hypothetical protein ACYC2H_05365 [Thermoplasmatota archaeon]
MATNAPLSRRNRLWGKALRDQNEDRQVRCDHCDLAATIETPDGADVGLNREAWPELPCVFTPGCPGSVVPESLN